jgi:uncharacterized membrane protein
LQWIGNAFSVVLYGILLSVVAFFWLDPSFFTLQRIVIIYISYVVAVLVVGIAGVSFAVRRRKALDQIHDDKPTMQPASLN